MERGTYAAASAGLNQLRKLDVINNNLANVNTPGFKRQILVREERAFEDTLAGMVDTKDPYARGDHERVHGTVHVRSITDFSQGPIKNTGNELDVALREPDHFFVIDVGEGKQHFTRAGNFTLNGEGQLVTHEGHIVRGDGGAITAEGAGMKISPGGIVTSNGQNVGRLQVVKVDDPAALERSSGTRFSLVEGAAPPQPIENAAMEVQALEMSNVTAIQSVMELISANRGFNLYTKMARSIDEMNNIAITRVGRKG